MFSVGLPLAMLAQRRTSIQPTSFIYTTCHGIQIHGFYWLGRNSCLRLYTSQSDVCRRQILTYKVDPLTEKIKTLIMAVDP